MMETKTSTRLAVKNISQADETRKLPKTKIEVVNLGDVTIARATFEPGWKWSECLKPTVGTDSCQVAHTSFIISGRMKVIMDDGQEREIGPGDVAIIAPGHDAFVVGNEPCIGLDFTGGKTYGLKR